MRIELTNKGFADLCLTTWLPRRNREGGFDHGALGLDVQKFMLVTINKCPKLADT